MSLAIHTQDVTAVLLADGRWRNVANKSFTVDAYEFIDTRIKNVPMTINGTSEYGFALTTPDGARIAGPLTAVLAVRREPVAKPSAAA